MSDKLATLRTKRDEVATKFDEADVSVRSLEELKGGKAIPAYAALVAARDAHKAELDKIDEQIASEEKAAATEGFIKPLIEFVGKLEVSTSEGMPGSVHINDVESLLNKAKDAAKIANSKVLVFSKLAEAIAAANIPEDVIGDLRPLHIKPDGETHIVLEVATRAARTGGGSGVSRSTQRIDAVGVENGPDLVGKVVGKNGDFKSWRDLIEKTDPTWFAELEQKKNESNNNYSAADKATRKWKLTVSDVAPETTETTETPAS